MPEALRVIYWDSNVFLSYLNGIPERLPALDALLESSSNGSIRLYTAELSRVEVAFAASEQMQRALSEDIERHIDDLWSDENVVALVEHHSSISLGARTLMRSAIVHGWSLKPFDAIHLATAQWLKSIGMPIQEFHTYDGPLMKYGQLVGLDILEPYVRQFRMI